MANRGLLKYGLSCAEPYFYFQEKRVNYYIYLTTNKINNNKYIGKRQTNKQISLDSYLGSGKLLKQAIKKYGKENFSKIILEECKNADELAEREKFYIEMYNAVNDDSFYNIHEGGNGGNTLKGLSASEMDILRKRRSDKAKALEQHRIDTMSPEEYKKFSEKRLANAKRGGEAFKKVGHTKEFKDAMRKKFSGENNPMFGKRPPDSVIEKLKNGRHDWNKGHKMSQEQKDKISASLKKKFSSPEMREKLRNRKRKS